MYPISYHNMFWVVSQDNTIYTKDISMKGILFSDSPIWLHYGRKDM